MVRCRPISIIKLCMCLACIGYITSVISHLHSTLFALEKHGPLHNENSNPDHQQLKVGHDKGKREFRFHHTAKQGPNMKALNAPALEAPVKEEPHPDAALGAAGGGKEPQPDAADVRANDTGMKQAMLMPPPEPEDKYAYGELWRGALGHPVIVDPNKLSAEEKAKYDKGWKDHKFNEYVSNMISLHRSIPPVTIKECHKRKYPSNMPNTSVILVFRNEAWSTLLRTVHSVIDRSPPELLREVILVDDASDAPHIQQPLEDYIATLPNVRILRLPQRGGLIKARLLGAREARGQVITYLDSHCECFPGWLEPLLARIALNSTTVVCPIIESIDDTTFQVVENDYFYIGGFDWDLIFSWKEPSKERREARKTRADEFTSPTMAGGLFAIDRKFFEHLGTYDPEFDFWGGENLELSFKLWMCGGRLEFVPCSRVGHVFRKDSPHKDTRSNGSSIVWNTLRVAAVWMDEYKHVYFSSFPKLPDYGDVTQRMALRSRLQCKSFDWYLKEVYTEGFAPERLGSFENRQSPMCLDSHASRIKYRSSDTNVIAYPCHGQGGTQAFMITKKEEIRKVGWCLDYNNGNVTMMTCHGIKGNQHWIYGQDATIRMGNVPDNCLVLGHNNELKVERCQPANLRHQWKGPPDLTEVMEREKSQRAHQVR